MLIIAIVALQQQKHRGSLNIILSHCHPQIWGEGIVIDEMFGADDLKGCEVGVDAAGDEHFGCNDVVE
jgi:hypothetical protein